MTRVQNYSMANFGSAKHPKTQMQVEQLVISTDYAHLELPAKKGYCERSVMERSRNIKQALKPCTAHRVTLKDLPCKIFSLNAVLSLQNWIFKNMNSKALLVYHTLVTKFGEFDFSIWSRETYAYFYGASVHKSVPKVGHQGCTSSVSQSALLQRLLSR